MSFDSTAVVCGDFPNPIEQAQAILEASDADVQLARSLVWARIRLAMTVDELLYWCQVDKLVLKSGRFFSIHTPSGKEAER